MPYKDGRMTPAEKRAMEKRYGVTEGNYTRPGVRNEDGPDTFEDRLIKAASNDYDTRKAQETLNLALKNEDYRNSLSKKAQNFVNEYQSSDKKDQSGMLGISNFKELQAVNDFGKIYHKHDLGNRGSYSSANDYGGGSMHMMDSMRNYYSGSSAKDAESEKKSKVKTPKSLLPKNYTPSEETASAQDFISQYERSIRNSPDGLLDTGSMGESQTLKGTSFNAEDASEENDKAQGFFQDQLLNLTEGFKKYNINTVGPNSIASKNNDLLRTFPTT